MMSGYPRSTKIMQIYIFFFLPIVYQSSWLEGLHWCISIQKDGLNKVDLGLVPQSLECNVFCTSA